MCGPIQGPACGDCQQIKAVNFDKAFFKIFQKVLGTFLSKGNSLSGDYVVFNQFVTSLLN
jgi:hypothetical protein